MKKLDTLCVHAGKIRDHENNGLISPVFPSTSHLHLDAQEDIYPRHGNSANQLAVERKIAELEGAESAVLFSSGMAALTAFFSYHLDPKDHVIIQKNGYSGVKNIFTNHFSKYGIDFTFVDMSNEDNIRMEIKPETKFIYFESPTNPLCEISDIRKICNVAKSESLISIFDNTIATPINQSPISHGVDVVLHSATKYLGGHGDITGGAIAGNAKFVEPVRAFLSYHGGCLSPQSCHLLERSMKTLAIRVTRINQNAMALSEFLTQQEGIESVLYSGLPTHPNHELAKSQMSGFGGLVTFTLSPTISSDLFQSNLKLITPANSLGEVETTLNCPLQASSSFSSLPETDKVSSGISWQTIRMSVGIESVSDIAEDIAKSLVKSEV